MYPTDFETDETVRRLDFEGIGFYVTLLNFAWTSDGIPPDFVLNSGKLLKLNPRTFRRLWKQVESKFPVAADGRFRNPRQEVERAKAVKLHQDGVKGAKARWKNHAPPYAPTYADSMRSDMGSQCHPQPEPEPEQFSTEVLVKNSPNLLLRPARANAAAAAANGSVIAHDFPLTATAVRNHYPATDDRFITSLVHAAAAAAADVPDPKPAFSDELCADAVRHCAHQSPRQQSAGLFLTTVPRFVETALRRGLDAAIPKPPQRDNRSRIERIIDEL